MVHLELWAVLNEQWTIIRNATMNKFLIWKNFIICLFRCTKIRCFTFQQFEKQNNNNCYRLNLSVLTHAYRFVVRHKEIKTKNNQLKRDLHLWSICFDSLFRNKLFRFFFLFILFSSSSLLYEQFSIVLGCMIRNKTQKN